MEHRNMNLTLTSRNINHGKEYRVRKVWVKSMQWKREELNVSHHHYALYMYSLTNTVIIDPRQLFHAPRWNFFVYKKAVYIDTHKITRIRHWIKISHLIILWAANNCYGWFDFFTAIKIHVKNCFSLKF